MLCDVVRRRRHRRRRWAHAPVIHAASHFYHEKRVPWVSISMHACDPVPIVMGLRSAALRAAGAPLLWDGQEGGGWGRTRAKISSNRFKFECSSVRVMSKRK